MLEKEPKSSPNPKCPKKSAAEAAEISLDARAETLSVQDFAAMAARLRGLHAGR